MSATRMTCATLSTVSRPSMSHHSATIETGLSKPVLLGQLRPFGGSAKVLGSIHFLDCDASYGRNMSSALSAQQAPVWRLTKDVSRA